MDVFKDNNGMGHLWNNGTNLTNGEDDDQIVNVNFNMKNSTISVKSNEILNFTGEPIYEWKMNIKSGQIFEITRSANKESIIETSIDPKTLKTNSESLGPLNHLKIMEEEKMKVLVPASAEVA